MSQRFRQYLRATNCYKLSGIALEGLPTAGTFVPLECVAELHHISSSLRLSFAPRRARSAQLPRRAVTAQRGTPVGWRWSFRRAKITSPLSPEGAPRAAAVRLRQDRLGAVRESGTVRAGAVRIRAIPRIVQRGQVDHQENPGGPGGK